MFFALLPTPISHVIVVVQQHRTVDNLFNGFPGADTVTQDPVSHTNLGTISFTTLKSPNHGYADFQTYYANGAMNGWAANTLFYVVDPELQRYWGLAKQYALADEVFTAQEGESLGAGLFLISGQAGGIAADNLGAFAESPGGGNTPVGCASPNPGLVVAYNTPYPAPEATTASTCRDWPSIFDSATSWKFYSPSATDRQTSSNVLSHLYNAQPATVPETQFLTDIAGGSLAEVTFITPSTANSDFQFYRSNTGPSWVVSLVRAVCNSGFWPTTTILVTWDQWGGWFDHVVPPVKFFPPLCGGGGSCNPLEAGFRSPLLVISPYARAGLVDHTRRTQCAILAYMEATFQLPSLSACDSYSDLNGGSDTLSAMFDYTQTPAPCIADPASRRWPARGF